MKKIFLSLVCLLVCVLMTVPLLAGGPSGAYYTWASFSYSWNKNALPQIQLTNAVPTDKGYSVDYGYTSTLDIFVDRGAVLGTCANFVGGGENDAGGRIFTQLIAKSIEIGTFRWPQTNIDEVRNTFKIMGKTRKQYSYNTTKFIFDYDGQAGWQFCMEYLPEPR